MIACMHCADLRKFRLTVQRYYTYQRRKAHPGAILTHHTVSMATSAVSATCKTHNISHLLADASRHGDGGAAGWP